MDMAGYWKQQVINTLTKHTDMSTVDALRLPILLIGNKYDLVSVIVWLMVLIGWLLAFRLKSFFYLNIIMIDWFSFWLLMKSNRSPMRANTFLVERKRIYHLDSCFLVQPTESMSVIYLCLDSFWEMPSLAHEENVHRSLIAFAHHIYWALSSHVRNSNDSK